jgi:hypothetical protein
MVRPVDVQQAILQTNAVEKLQYVQQQQSSIQQSYIELRLKEEKRLTRETVQDSSKTEKTVIRDRAKDSKKKPPPRSITMQEILNDELEGEEDMEAEGKGKFINIKV